jgi:hypothetical protein
MYIKYKFLKLKKLNDYSMIFNSVYSFSKLKKNLKWDCDHNLNFLIIFIWLNRRYLYFKFQNLNNIFSFIVKNIGNSYFLF